MKSDLKLNDSEILFKAPLVPPETQIENGRFVSSRRLVSVVSEACFCAVCVGSLEIERFMRSFAVDTHAHREVRRI